ncbi:MAG: BamA/TamA family outer membrane protein [Planctomycetes bacterium]|nr:BamA/TamA family outer membrane protein [Planctomycetota bacterium]
MFNLRPLLGLVLTACIGLLVTGPLVATDPVIAQDPVTDTLVIDEIVLMGAGDREGQIRAALSLRAGEQMTSEQLMARWRQDVDFLWTRLRVRLESIGVEDISDDRVRVILTCKPVQAYRRVLFLGHDEGDLSRAELLLATGLTGAQYVDELQFSRVVSDIEVAFQAKGFHFVSVAPEASKDLDEVIFRIDSGPKVRVGKIEFSGNEALLTDRWVGTDLEGAVESGTGWLVFPGTPYIAGDTERLDIVALERLYHDFGYLEAKIVAAEPEFYRSNSRVKLHYEIDEGRLFMVGKVGVAPIEGAGPLRYPVEDLRAALELKPGDALEKSRITRDERALRNFYGELGHTSAQGVAQDGTFFDLTTERVLSDPERGVIDVIFRINEGEPKRVRDVLISGNRHTEDRVIRRDISLSPGDLADMGEAASSHRRLLGSGYFLDERNGQPWVDYRFTPTNEPGLVDLEFEVREGRGTGNILFGGGLSSNSGPFVSINLQKTNFSITDAPSSWGSAPSEILGGEAFTGGGQTLRLFMAPGSQFSTYRMSFFEPDLLREHVSRLGLRLDLYKTYRFLRTHDEDRTGFGITLSRRFGRHFSIFGGPRFEKVRLTDIDTNAPDEIGLDENYRLWKHTLEAGVSYSTILDKFSPADSEEVRFELRQNGKFMGGELDYIEADLRAGKYWGIWEDTLGRDWTIALEGRVRRAWSDEPVPYTERYWLGGSRTVRGFDFRGIERERGGYPIGGEASINASAELRFPIMSARVRENVDEFQWVRGAFFLDAGTYGDDFGGLTPTRVSAGIGIRIRLPMMPQFPIALDFGWPIASERFDDERVFHLNFGEF